MNFLDEWLFFSLSDKAKFAIKVALSITLTYLFILAMGLEYISVALITIMLIASPEGVKSAVSKGLMRIGGTIIGAVCGMILIAFFPQEPLLYLLSLSILVTVFLYLRQAFRGDETLFMLSAMTAMAVFDDGNVDDVFMYGINRTFITLLAIIIYTLVFVLIWPSKSTKNDSETLQKPLFIWGDPEHLKGAVQTFFIFWTATALWYFFNPPGGFMLVMLATGLSALTSFSPIKPSVMAIVINMSLLISIMIYIFVLPNLSHWIELSVVLFTYSFFAFYLFPPMLSVLVLIGMNTLMITNTMSYHVDLFLGIVLLMDMVFALLILAYYFPFSTKPEYLYKTFVQRLHKLAIMQYHPSKLFRWYASVHLTATCQKLHLWGNKIDYGYFYTIERSHIERLSIALDGLLSELNRHALSIDEQNELQNIFNSWYSYIRTPNMSLPISHGLRSAAIQHRLIECSESIRQIEWDHLERGRF